MDVKSSPQLPDVIVRNDRKTIHRWAMYDWANSAYALVIVSAIFPAYYNEITEVDGITRISLFGWNIENTAAYSINLGIAFGIVALISPLLSSMADYNGNHRSFMKFFCYMGAIGCMTLFFFSDYHLVQLGLAGMLFATIGYCGSIVFYNAYLPAIATEDMQDKVSARGYAYGYIGATTLLLVNLAFIMNQKVLGVMNDTLLPRLSFLLTGLWWLGFAQIPLRSLPEGIYAAKLKGRNLIERIQGVDQSLEPVEVKTWDQNIFIEFFLLYHGCADGDVYGFLVWGKGDTIRNHTTYCYSVVARIPWCRWSISFLLGFHENW